MSHTKLQQTNDIIFHPYLAWLLVKNAALVAFGVSCAVLAFQSNNLLWLTGVALATCAATILIAKYHANAVIIRGFMFLVRRGVLSTREHSIPLWRINLEVRRSLLGNMLGYGTVLLHLDGDIIEIRDIAPIHTLLTVIAQRQAEALSFRRS
jgi:uncharacterized membrane protein YdbT with pleckstrin-like domain